MTRHPCPSHRGPCRSACLTSTKAASILSVKCVNSSDDLAENGLRLQSILLPALEMAGRMPALKMPALKKIGDQIGVSMDDGLLDARRENKEDDDTPA